MKIFIFLYKLLSKNIALKLMAMFLTLVIWFIVLSSKQIESKKEIKIQYITPTGYTVQGAPNKILITLRGPKGFIDEIMSKEKYIYIDLRNKKPGYVSYTISKDIINLPINVEITKMNPKEIMPKIEKLKNKKVEIKPSLVGNITEGYELKSTKLTPNTMEISGPETYINQIKKLETAPIDISDLKGTLTLETQIDKKYTDKISNLKDKKISAYLELKPIIINKIYREIPIIVKGINNRRYKLNPKTVDIVLKGPQIILENLDSLDIKATIDITFNKKGSFKEIINIEAPENISAISTNPKQASIWIY